MDPKTLPQMPRWYSVDREGVAMLCQDEADARANAEESAQMYPHRAPYRAMRLGDVAAAYAAARAEGTEQMRRRLQWIESALFEKHWNGAIDSGSRTYWRLAGNYRHATARMVGDTFGEAVDAALRALPVEAPNAKLTGDQRP